MVYLASTEKMKLTANATLLTTAVDADDTTLVFDNKVFSNGNSITIGGETITLGTTADGGTTFTGCTRGGSPETHAAGQEAFLAAGTELVTLTFDGIKYLNAFSASANAEITIGIKEDATIKERVRLSSYNLSWFRPFHREVPANEKIWSLVAWLRYDVKTECEASGALQA